MLDDWEILTWTFHGSQASPRAGSDRIGSGVFRNLAGRVGSGRVTGHKPACGSGRIGSGVFRNLTGRVGSGRIGSDRVVWVHPDRIRPTVKSPGITSFRTSPTFFADRLLGNSVEYCFAVFVEGSGELALCEGSGGASRIFVSWRLDCAGADAWGQKGGIPGAYCWCAAVFWSFFLVLFGGWGPGNCCFRRCLETTCETNIIAVTHVFFFLENIGRWEIPEGGGGLWEFWDFP